MMSPQDNSAIVTAPQSEAAAFGTLPGEFAIRTRLKNTFLTARDGGHHTIDALITSATTIGPNEKFRLTSFQPDFITLQTPLGFFVSAIGGGGLGGDHDPTQILQTERTTVADDALFRLIGPSADGSFFIRTLNDHLLTALGGGGKTTAAFHTDATVANEWELFRIGKCGDLGSGYTYALRRSGATNLYLWSGSGSVASVLLDAQAHFKVIRLADGSFALQTVDGFHYLTADDGGGLDSGNVFLTTQTHIQAWERFKIVDQGDGTYIIQTVSGFFVGIAQNGAVSTRVLNPFSPPPGFSAKFELVMVGLVKPTP
jgi:hypothetical protein